MLANSRAVTTPTDPAAAGWVMARPPSSSVRTMATSVVRPNPAPGIARQ
ncbi:hypothetical protein LRS04_08855 [Phenylobacterium sp. J367]|nr:hypothetical protein [Phenylobacterium sp. J367]MCR5878447.1 hypothetical protein [Phenylobacterium sp. J367]